ncbi:MAG TPA: 30S ribosomal protein S4 [Atribacteraceae bacterium]|nr:30S ribosomal protein S4 [Atribacteraceae bacterium]
MSRYTGSKCRLCRRQGLKLLLKGPRCLSNKCAFEKRPFPPGPQRGGRRRVSSYGTQLREKQKVRFIYGITERQFNNYFARAIKLPGLPGETLLVLLEKRLDNVVFRLGLADSRSDARQMVRHGHYLINGKKASIPSLLVQKGDAITLSDKGKSNLKIKEITEEKGPANIPGWIEYNTETRQASLVSEPKRSDIEYDVQEKLIVEFYSR